MRFKIILFFALSIYIFSGSLIDIFKSDDTYSREIQKEIIINKTDINVFERKSLDDINVTQKKVKAWIIIINYEKDSEKKIITKLKKSGYSAKHNPKKMFYTLGPFVNSSHAMEESMRLKNIHGINNKIIDFIF
jgi:hypothetical protein